MTSSFKRLRRNGYRFDVSYGEFGTGEDGQSERTHLLIALKRLTEAAANPSEATEITRTLVRFMRRYANTLGIRLPDHVDHASGFDIDDVPRNEWHLVAQKLATAFDGLISPEPSLLDRRLDFLARAMGITPVEREILGILARASLFSIWEALVEKFADGDPLSHVPAIALMSGQSEDQTYNAYCGGGLVTNGLAEERFHPRRNEPRSTCFCAQVY